MRVTEALLRQNMQKKKDFRNEEDDAEETLAYKERKQEYWSINDAKGVFASPMADGLNSSESIFDKQAVFRTKQ